MTERKWCKICKDGKGLFVTGSDVCPKCFNKKVMEKAGAKRASYITPDEFFTKSPPMRFNFRDIEEDVMESVNAKNPFLDWMNKK